MAWFALGLVLGVLVRVWVWTLRLSLEVAPGARRDAGARGAAPPRVLGFLHGEQMALLRAPRGRGTTVLVSLSRDGALQAGVMTALGFAVRRGSSSRGGGPGARALLRALRGGADAALAVDGPRGPRGEAKPGAAFLAAAADASLVPVASAASRAVVIESAWDRFEVPVPFSRVAVVVGEPVCAADARHEPALLSRSIAEARARAELLLVSRRRPWQSGAMREGGPAS